MNFYIKIGDIYLQALYVDVNCSDTEFITSLDFCADKNDIFTSATFDNEQKAKSVIYKISRLFYISSEFFTIITEKSDYNE